MKQLIILTSSLLITACNFNYQSWEKGDFKLIRCDNIYGCEFDRAFSTKESCEEIKQKLSGPAIAYTCEEVK